MCTMAGKKHSPVSNGASKVGRVQDLKKVTRFLTLLYCGVLHSTTPYLCIALYLEAQGVGNGGQHEGVVGDGPLDVSIDELLRPHQDERLVADKRNRGDCGVTAVPLGLHAPEQSTV